MKSFVVLEKEIGETPLVSAEKWRAENPEYNGFPLAYAGRLDPMASGKLLILIGDECKKQAAYHGLDKRYEFSILFGVTSDTADVLGRLVSTAKVPLITKPELEIVSNKLVGDITLPYPHFSSKTVNGKSLLVWTLENRLDEIEIPEITSTVYDLSLESLTSLSKTEIVNTALAKIETIPTVTDANKALGNDFRRVDVRQDWNNLLLNTQLPETYTIATFSCIASSGTYMRSLAEVIAKELGTIGLAWHIHRTKIGIFDSENNRWTLEY